LIVNLSGEAGFFLVCAVEINLGLDHSSEVFDASTSSYGNNGKLPIALILINADLDSTALLLEESEITVVLTTNTFNQGRLKGNNDSL
jgi:hypothetical protein